MSIELKFSHYEKNIKLEYAIFKTAEGQPLHLNLKWLDTIKNANKYITLENGNVVGCNKPGKYIITDEEYFKAREVFSKPKRSSILEKANNIVNNKSEEAVRQYGPFGKCMEITCDIYNSMTGESMTPEQSYIFMVAHKFARQRNAHKEDNLLDAVAYIGGLDNYINDIVPEEAFKTTGVDQMKNVVTCPTILKDIKCDTDKMFESKVISTKNSFGEFKIDITLTKIIITHNGRFWKEIILGDFEQTK